MAEKKRKTGAYSQRGRGTGKTVALAPVIGRYFEAWICLDTWDSYHPLDERRFYRFVKAVARYTRRVLSPADIHALIVERRDGQQDRAELNKTAKQFAERYQTLLDYEKTGGFPDALIERTDIVKYYVQLSISSRENKQHINRMMTEVWGKDWRVDLDKEMGVSLLSRDQ